MIIVSLESFDFFSRFSCQRSKYYYFCGGEMAERSNAAVLKTVVPKGTGGSNPSFSARKISRVYSRDFLFSDVSKTLSFRKRMKIKNLSLRLSKLGDLTCKVSPQWDHVSNPQILKMKIKNLSLRLSKLGDLTCKAKHKCPLSHSKMFNTKVLCT